MSSTTTVTDCNCTAWEKTAIRCRRVSSFRRPPLRNPLPELTAVDGRVAPILDGPRDVPLNPVYAKSTSSVTMRCQSKAEGRRTIRAEWVFKKRLNDRSEAERESTRSLKARCQESRIEGTVHAQLVK